MIFPTPLISLCQLQHDSGFSVDGVPDTDFNGRQGQSFTIPDGTPNGWGARLVISAQGKVSLMQRGILYFNTSTTAAFFADDFVLSDVQIVYVPVEPDEPDIEPIPTNPAAIINWVYATGSFDLETKSGCGQFTEACVKVLHVNNSVQWGLIKKFGAQNQYNGHAVDAVMLLNTAKGTPAGIYDIIFSSESPEAEPAFNFSGPPDVNLWYYPY